MQASQATRRDEKNNVEDANKKIVDFIYKLLSTSILATIDNNFAMRTYINNIALCQILINIIRSLYYF